MSKFGGLAARIAADKEEAAKLQASLATPPKEEVTLELDSGEAPPANAMASLRARMAGGSTKIIGIDYGEAVQEAQPPTYTHEEVCDQLVSWQEERKLTLSERMAAKRAVAMSEALTAQLEEPATLTMLTLEGIVSQEQAGTVVTEAVAAIPMGMSEKDSLAHFAEIVESAQEPDHEEAKPIPTVAAQQPDQALSLSQRLAARKQTTEPQSIPLTTTVPSKEVPHGLEQQPQAMDQASQSSTEQVPEPLSLKERVALRKAAEVEADRQFLPTSWEVEQRKIDSAAQLKENTTTLALRAALETPAHAALDHEQETVALSLRERMLAKKMFAEQKAMAGEAPAPIKIAGVDDSPTRELVHETPPHDVHAPANRQVVTLNEKQSLAVGNAIKGLTFCMIGAAGTGKTTSVRQLCKELLASGVLNTVNFKRQGGEGAMDRVDGLSIALVAFTRRAANNLRDSICADPELKEHFYASCQTIHNLLEFFPEDYEVEDKETGELRQSMHFVPNKGAWDKLTITHLVIEEGSMVGLDLADMLMQALENGVQIIYIGDINQLPPVFGASILSYALVKLPIVELTEVYRQALDSGIIRNAHNILAGRPLEYSDDFMGYEEYAKGKGLGIKKLNADMPEGGTAVQAGPAKLSQMYASLFKGLHGKGDYDPEQDIILSPFNKHELGTVNLNNHIAQFLGELREAVVYEVVTGFEKWYLAEGDRVMVDKQDGGIVHIEANAGYLGATPQIPGSDLSRFGVRKLCAAQAQDLDSVDYGNFNLDAGLDEDAGERKRAASHKVQVQLDMGDLVTLNNAADFSQQRFSLGYCLTVHKSQGCEWRKVFFILHKSHHVMANRELFYTGATRAREKCIMLAKQTTLDHAIKSQRIKGNSTAEKIEFFNSGALADVELVMVERPKLAATISYVE